MSLPLVAVAASRLGPGRVKGWRDGTEATPSAYGAALRRAAPGLVVTGRSPDRLVEAVETPPGGPWCLGVQWHPERNADVDPQQQALFDAFAGALR